MNRSGFLKAVVGLPLVAALLSVVDRSLSATVDNKGTVTLTAGPDFAGTLEEIRITSDSCGGKPTKVYMSGRDARGFPIEETIVLYDKSVETRQAFRGREE